MSPHIPTTDDVRAAYVGKAPVLTGEFDRWLAQVKAEALREAADALPALTEGANREGTRGWPEDQRDTYSIAIEEAQDALRKRAEDLP